MNYRNILNIIGKILILEACLLLLPCVVAIIYKEPSLNVFSFLITMAILLVIGILLNIKKASSKRIMPKEGMVIVAFSWLLMALFGSLPFIISKEIGNFFDAFFEICSGFSTTGASILNNVEALSESMLFWRSFSHWIGGMGVLVFILAIIPDGKEGSSMHILRAESPGPQVGKLVSKMRVTARILYFIYIFITILECILLWAGPDKDLNFINSLMITFGTVGTGGFGILSTSIASYSAYSQYVIAIFMMISGINFTLFYFLIIGKGRQVFRSEEFRVYLAIIVLATIAITSNIFTLYDTFEETFRHSFFQVVSIMTTTGFTTVDYYMDWPSLAHIVIILLMFIGACSGSTGGAIKVSRITILIKATWNRILKIINPRHIRVIKYEGKQLDDNVISSVQSYFVAYLLILAGVVLIISIDGYDIMTNFTAALSCISNVGPGFNKVGPSGNFAFYSDFSKFVLSILMITGRLEVFPILIIFTPTTWKRYN